MKQERNNLYVIAICVSLALATIIAYEPIRLNGFVNYDDDLYVTENPNVNRGITGESILWAFTASRNSNWHPLTWLSHMLDCELFGLNPAGHHIINLFFHIANTLLLFWVLKRMTGAIWQSAFVAAAFALHPLHVESVAWVAERKDVLSGFFWMLTIGCYIRYTEQPGVRRYLLVFLVFALGLMAKPMLVTLPFVLLLLDYWPLGRLQWGSQGDSQGRPVWRLVGEKVPLFILTVASSVITFIIQQKGGAMDVGKSYSLGVRISNTLVCYVGYLIKTAYPANLSVLYPHPGDSLPMWQVIVSLLIVVAASVAVIYGGRRRRYLVTGWFWYLGVLVPVAGIVQVGAQAMADRYTYLSSIGIFIMAAWGAGELSAKWRYRKLAIGTAAGIALACLLICSRLQVRYWQDNFKLFGHSIAVTENNYLMHDSFGGALFEKGQFDDAIAQFREALRINPEYSGAKRNIGIVLLKQGKIDESIKFLTEAANSKGDQFKAHNYLGLAYAEKGELDTAIQHYKEAIRFAPDYVEAIANLGIALKEQGRVTEAIKEWERALLLKPDEPDVHYNMALAMAEQYKYDKAIKHFSAALESKPNWPEALYNLGCAYYEQGKFELTVKYCAEALRLKPDYYNAHYNMGLAFVQQGRYDDAAKCIKAALELKPDWPEAHHNLGYVYYRQGKLDLAEEQCAEALCLAPEYLTARLTLASILSETGKIEQAVEHYYEILRLDPNETYALKNLAWILATTEDAKLHNPTDAIKYAQKACELTGYNRADFLDTLAAAYAAAGNFGEAVETTEKALKLAEGTNEKELAKEIGKRLELYKAGQPYHEK
jgi:tetratricopeptide (TPR) repeat protein